MVNLENKLAEEQEKVWKETKRAEKRKMRSQAKKKKSNRLQNNNERTHWESRIATNIIIRHNVGFVLNDIEIQWYSLAYILRIAGIHFDVVWYSNYLFIILVYVLMG